MPSPAIILAFLISVCFSLACLLQAHSENWFPLRTHSGGMVQILFGDARRIFADELFVKADIYYHNGYYPSLFDQAHKPAHQEVADATQADRGHGREHEKEMDFLGSPKDWIDRFGRNFFPSQHSHMEKPGAERELLPWFRISAEMDPHRIETYTVAGFWLRTRLKKIKEAEEFLREGWRANPDSYAILIELGSLLYGDLHDPVRARNLWELALKKWVQQEGGKQNADLFSYEQIVAHLADLEEREGNLEKAIGYLEKLVSISPDRPSVEKQLIELKEKTNRRDRR